MLGVVHSTVKSREGEGSQENQQANKELPQIKQELFVGSFLDTEAKQRLLFFGIRGDGVLSALDIHQGGHFPLPPERIRFQKGGKLKRESGGSLALCVGFLARER